jgi:hypothetical protein
VDYPRTPFLKEHGEIKIPGASAPISNLNTRSGFQSKRREMKANKPISIDLIIPTAIWPWIERDENRNEYQESSWE